MTVCGNKLSGVCGGCAYFNRCRNDEIAKLPKSHIEWMREASVNELAEFLTDELNDVIERVLESVWLNDGDTDGDEYYQRKSDVVEWLKRPHTPIS